MSDPMARAKPFLPGWRPLAGFVGVLLVTALSLDAMGRGWWCGGAAPWVPWNADVWSRHNSQHLFDPYAATHVLHGVLFYGLVWLVLADWASARARWWIALVMEAGWEVLENTPPVIERYRDASFALGYAGDSIVNSLGDLLSFAAGYGLAMVLPVWASLLVFALVEGALVLTIRDSLVLNVVMLVAPLEALKEWQTGGRP